MQKILLDVSHLKQSAESDCLPICAMMVLASLEVNTSYTRLTKLLGTRLFGTPSDNIQRLSQLGVNVTLTKLLPTEIYHYLREGSPVIAFVSTADFPHWDVDTDHTVVVIGMDEEMVYINDPYFSVAPQEVLHALFELSQLKFNYKCAVLKNTERKLSQKFFQLVRKVWSPRST